MSATQTQSNKSASVTVHAAPLKPSPSIPNTKIMITGDHVPSETPFNAVSTGTPQHDYMATVVTPSSGALPQTGDAVTSGLIGAGVALLCVTVLLLAWKFVHKSTKSYKSIM